MVFWSQEPAGLVLALMRHTASLHAQEWDVMRTCHAGTALSKLRVAGAALPAAQDTVFKVLNGVLWAQLQVGQTVRLLQHALPRDRLGSTVMVSTTSVKHVMGTEWATLGLSTALR